MSRKVILVDREDRQVGVMAKLEAHEKGLLHRAFSIFIFNSQGELLLQKRANCKYHTPGLWTNACCSHQVEGEDVQRGLNRRLKEEMGLDVTAFQKALVFLYRAKLDNGLTEHEFDHVYFAVSDDTPLPNPEEVSEWKYLPTETLKNDILESPHLYTPWFKQLLQPVLDKFHSNQFIYNK